MVSITSPAGSPRHHAVSLPLPANSPEARFGSDRSFSDIPRTRFGFDGSFSELARAPVGFRGASETYAARGRRTQSVRGGERGSFAQRGIGLSSLRSTADAVPSLWVLHFSHFTFHSSQKSLLRRAWSPSFGGRGKWPCYPARRDNKLLAARWSILLLC